MSAATTDLAIALRAELAAIEPARRCCRAAERAGLGPAALGRARTPLLGRLAVRLDDAAGEAMFDWATAPEHDRIAWLRGALLANGSLSVTSTGTHLELIVDPPLMAPLGEWLAARGYPAGARIRRGRGVLTWKSAESILALLRRLGAAGVTLEMESRFIGRAVAGQLNRVVNAEHANLRRAVAAARRQLADIDSLERQGTLRRMPRQVRLIARARRRAPEATFSQLAADLDMSRGQVQRAFGLIESAALHEAAE
ncbi:MAG TPA: DNA-binding protein WhiA [Candidatus Limnocylindria bacterium]|nr:DNA-binding protein WhiA [Candidatus Limnocylindria bacterium]